MTQVMIGMPLYNNARTLATALDSLLSQTFASVKIFASDDCSADETSLICERFAQRDSRFQYVRQPRNLNYRNFKYVLDHADTPYFMWAAGDDRWAPTFISENVAALERDPSLVCSVSKVLFEVDGRPVRLAEGTFPLCGGTEENLAKFLSNPADNSRMYGVFRTECLKRAFPDRVFHAYDWALSSATLLHGNHHEVQDVLLFRDWTPPSRYSRLVKKDNQSRLQRLFPVYDMSRWLLREAKLPKSRRILSALFALNIDKHFEYLEQLHPKYFRRTRWLALAWNRYVRWRLLTM
jgi:glycosyltransferase involved in cell wall biosynthesis